MDGAALIDACLLSSACHLDGACDREILKRLVSGTSV